MTGESRLLDRINKLEEWFRESYKSDTMEITFIFARGKSGFVSLNDGYEDINDTLWEKEICFVKHYMTENDITLDKLETTFNELKEKFSNSTVGLEYKLKAMNL